jgi:hypothetical protein
MVLKNNLKLIAQKLNVQNIALWNHGFSQIVDGSKLEMLYMGQNLIGEYCKI